MKLPSEVAGFDSASAMVVALARFLHGQDTPPMGKPAFRALHPVARAASLLPARVQEPLYSLFSGAEGKKQSQVAELDLDSVYGGVADAYPRRRYPAVVIGSSGGSLVHLCAAFGVPWLPQTLLLPVQQKGLSPDEPRRAVHALAGTARALLDRNPDVVLHHMHDRGLAGDRLFVDSFMLLDPWWTLRAGAAPYWSVFPVEPSLDELHRYLDSVEPYDHIQLALFCHGADTAGMATPDQWRDLLSRARISGTFGGVSPRRYPRDFRTSLGFQDALRAVEPRHPMPEPFPIAALDQFLSRNTPLSG